MNKSGLTLIEVIVATLILTLTASGVIFIFSKAVVFRSGHMTEAMDFCRQTLEELRNYVGEDTWPEGEPFLTSGVHTSSLPAGNFRDRYGATRQYTVEDIDLDEDGYPDYKTVTVEVNWTEPLRNR